MADPQPNPPPNPNPAPPPPAAEWFSPEQKDYVGNKGWKAPAEAIGAYQNLETLLGAEKAGRTVVLPKDDKDADGIKAFRAKLGVPEKAEDYQLPVPQGADGNFAKTAAGWMHELGVPLKQAQALTEKWNGFFAKVLADKAASDEATSKAAVADLQKEWGAKFEENGEMGRRFAKELGVSADELNAIESALGTARMLKLFHGGGVKLGEPGAITDAQKGGFTAAGQKAAQEQIAAIRQQRIAGTLSQKDFDEQMSKLGPVAYPGERAA